MSKISWVSWSDVCKNKNIGGLGIRDLGSFNIVLIRKWMWRLINEPNSIWVTVLKSKYGEVPGCFHIEESGGGVK